MMGFSIFNSFFSIDFHGPRHHPVLENLSVRRLASPNGAADGLSSCKHCHALRFGFPKMAR